MQHSRSTGKFRGLVGSLMLMVGLVALDAGAVGESHGAAAGHPSSTERSGAARTALQGQRRATTTRARARARARNGNARLQDLADQTHALAIRMDPYAQIQAGERSPEADTRMPDLRPRVQHRNVRRMLAVDRQLERTIDVAALSPEQMQTYGAIKAQAEYALQLDSTKIYHWNVNQVWDEHHLVQILGSSWHSIRNRGDVDTLIARYAQVPRVFEQKLAVLRNAARYRQRAPKLVVDRVVQQLDAMIAAPESFVGVIAQRPDGMSEAEHARARADLEHAVATHVVPALTRYRDGLRALPTRETIGLYALPAVPSRGFPGGAAVYRGMLRYFAGREVDPDALHEQGLALVEGFKGRMTEAGRKLVPSLPADASFEQVVAAVSALPGQKLDPDAYVAKVREGLADVRAFSPALGITPADHLPLEVKSLPPGGPAMPLAFAPGVIDRATGKVTSPGRVMVNGQTPFPTSDIASARMHEVGGHYSQWILAPRKASHPVVDVAWTSSTTGEGGAVYVEMLANEHQQFRSDEDQFGHYNQIMFRAARLVVDTGIHARGWTREQAVSYLTSNTALSRDAASREVDRYVGLPGIAVSYMTGALALRDLRDGARATLGTRFDEPAFNRLVLSSKTMPISAVDARVQAWVRQQQRQ